MSHDRGPCAAGGHTRFTARGVLRQFESDALPVSAQRIHVPVYPLSVRRHDIHLQRSDAILIRRTMHPPYLTELIEVQVNVEGDGTGDGDDYDLCATLMMARI